jgi:adenylosuccinate synthase
MEGAMPNLTFVPGWLEDTTSARSFDQLPANVHRYITELEGHLGARVRYIGVGPDREQLIERTA